MHRKGAQDAKRAKLFTKIAREITTAAKISDDPSSNPRLRAAIALGRANNMPNDNINRAIKKGTGGEGDTDYVEMRYEGYGPGGIAIMVDCMTDNRTRTVADVRHAFSKHGGNLGSDGSVGYLFSRQGILAFSVASDADDERILEIALEAGAEALQAPTRREGDADRRGGFRDASGTTWWVATQLEEDHG